MITTMTITTITPTKLSDNNNDKTMIEAGQGCIIGLFDLVFMRKKTILYIMEIF